MQLDRHLERLRDRLSLAAEGDREEEARAAQRLIASLDDSVRLMLLDVLAAAAAEITRELAPGSVELRLRGSDPEFVVSTPRRRHGPAPAATAAAAEEPARRRARRRAARAPWRGSTCACPSSSRPGSSRPPRRRACRSTPGSCGRSPRWSSADGRRPAESPSPLQRLSSTRDGGGRCHASSTPAPIELELELIVADVRIEAGDRADTVVEVRPGDPVQARRRGRRRADADRAQPRPAPGQDPQDLAQPTARSATAAAVEVRVELPAGSSVAAQDRDGLGSLQRRARREPGQDRPGRHRRRAARPARG